MEDGTLVAESLLPRAKGLEVGDRLGRGLAVESHLDPSERLATGADVKVDYGARECRRQNEDQLYACGKRNTPYQCR